jgi:uncharacterized protein (DUF2141 family)
MLNRRPRIPCFALLLLANVTGSLQAQDTNPNAPAQPTTRLESVRVQIHGIRNTNGDIACAIFNAAEGYPEESTKAYKFTRMASPGNSAICQFHDIPPGTYAVAVFHDENANGKLDKNFLGIPREGYGASNNVRPKMSAPAFKDTAFSVKAGGTTTLNIDMGY